MAFTDRVEFTKEMKKEGYTILAPNMAPIHFRLFENLFASYGYNVEILQTRGRQIVDEGLKYVHNDTCYPALLTIGQMMDALHSGKYSPFEKGVGKRRPFVYSGHFAQHVRT